MSNNRRIYVLEDGLTPETKAVCFAKCSRAPEPFDQIARELTEEKSSEFHEKWVVGYGHSSVAEHAVISMAIENVSILATKIIEDNRLASYTEKSTRYQIFNKNTYHKPKKLMLSDLARVYEESCDFLFETYEKLTPIMMEFARKKYPKSEKMSDRLYESVTKARACDNVRYLLPASTLTNLGMTLNARALEWAITKLTSHTLEEMQGIGAEMKEAALKIIPTLIKYADKNKYLQETEQALSELSSWLINEPQINPAEPVHIVDYDKTAENKIVASLLYKNVELPYSQIKHKVDTMPESIKHAVIEDALKRRKSYDRPVREFEHIYYTFDILMDFGAFRDVQRHRMATQTNQKLTTKLGYETPEEIIEAGYEKEYTLAMKRAENAYEKISARFPQEAQYAVPLGYRKRTLFTWNLRELHHFISLRSGKKGHISYRRIAQACYRELCKIHPLLAKYIDVDLSDETLSTIGTKEKQQL